MRRAFLAAALTLSVVMIGNNTSGRVVVSNPGGNVTFEQTTINGAMIIMTDAAVEQAISAPPAERQTAQTVTFTQCTINALPPEPPAASK